MRRRADYSVDILLRFAPPGLCIVALKMVKCMDTSPSCFAYTHMHAHNNSSSIIKYHSQTV
jgi:hypothetical protein